MKDRPRMLSWDGADADFIWFSTDSWTRPGSGISHTIAICKRSGVISCTCEDCTMRRKQIHVLLESDAGCKHIRAVRRWMKQRILAAMTGGE